MFTGIVEEIGTVKEIRRGAQSSRVVLEGEKVFGDLKPGDSVAVNGVCLTAAEISGNTFAADIMHETLNRSNLGSLRQGSRVNMERAIAAGERFGGHIVSGHIDGTGIIKNKKRDDNAVWFTVEADREILKYIVIKGSITIDGISLTVAAKSEKDFSVSIIPHTMSVTILGEKGTGSTVNLENDIIGKYVEQMLINDSTYSDSRNRAKEGRGSSGGVTESMLAENGFL